MRRISSAALPASTFSSSASFGEATHCRDLLMDLDDADPEEVLDEREDRSVVPLQQPADRGEGPVDVVLGVADRFRRPSACLKPRTHEPLRADGQPGVRREFLVEGHHGVGLDVELAPRWRTPADR